jgi:hypothetical protein
MASDDLLPNRLPILCRKWGGWPAFYSLDDLRLDLLADELTAVILDQCSKVVRGIAIATRGDLLLYKTTNVLR